MVNHDNAASTKDLLNTNYLKTKEKNILLKFLYLINQISSLYFHINETKKDNSLIYHEADRGVFLDLTSKHKHINCATFKDELIFLIKIETFSIILIIL